jgi:transposase-like protein
VLQRVSTTSWGRGDFEMRAAGVKVKGRAQYLDEEKASALVLLAVYNGNVKRTARTLGIPRSTLTAWAKGRGTNPGVTKQCHFKKESLADRFEEVARALLDAAADPAKLADASLKDLVIAAGICTDKMLLLRGQPTRLLTNADGTLRGMV